MITEAMVEAALHTYWRAGHSVPEEIKMRMTLEAAFAAHASEDKMKGKTMSKAVLITTEYRGVFFGYTEDTSGDVVTLTNARNCIYWPPAQGGFMGLASEGPAEGSRIGAKVERIELRKVTSITEVSDAAVTKWEASSVYRG
jgi:hypothetical protein